MGSSTATHQGIVCDKSGMNPIVGTRYSLRGGNYDLCEAEFFKLPPGEQAKYDMYKTPRGRPEPAGQGSGPAASRARPGGGSGQY